MARKETPLYLNIPIHKDLKDRLESYVESKGMLKRKVVEFALREYFEKNKSVE